MIQICHCCEQVIPETNKEKGIAKASAAIARRKLDEAQTVWKAYSKAHPVRGFLVRNSGLGLIAAICLTAILFGSSLSLLSNRGMINSYLLVVTFIGCCMVGYALMYFLHDRPREKNFNYRMAVRNAFILRHKAQSDTLGFTMYCS